MLILGRERQARLTRWERAGSGTSRPTDPATWVCSFLAPSPRPAPHRCPFRAPPTFQVQETREGGEERVLPTGGTDHAAKRPPGVQSHPPTWLRRREAGVCHVPGTADQLDCYVLFCEAFPAPLCVTWYLVSLCHDTTSAHCGETSQPAPTSRSGSASRSSLSPCPQPRA